MKNLYALLFLFSPFLINAQYSEDFPTDDKGVEGPCSSNNRSSCTTLSDFSGVTWTISGPLSAGLTASNDYAKTVSGAIELKDTDEDICWQSPSLDISTAGNVSLSVPVVWTGFDDDQGINASSHDYLDIEYSVDGGGYTRILNLHGTGAHTVNVSGDNQNGTGTATASGISGSTLDIRACVSVTSSTETGRFDNISVPEPNVSIIPLPVELISFKAKEVNEKILLSWETATELNNEKFEIEYAKAGKEFIKIADVKGAGTSFKRTKYSFTHHHPKPGLNYYRLKQIDIDGSTEYSKIISINLTGEKFQIGEFYPNPNHLGFASLDFISKTESSINISVIDLTGKILYQNMKQIFEGENDLVFDFTSIGKGVFIIRIENERNLFYKKLILK